MQGAIQVLGFFFYWSNCRKWLNELYKWTVAFSCGQSRHACPTTKLLMISIPLCRSTSHRQTVFMCSFVTEMVAHELHIRVFQALWVALSCVLELISCVYGFRVRFHKSLKRFLRKCIQFSLTFVPSFEAIGDTQQRHFYFAICIHNLTARYKIQIKTTHLWLVCRVMALLLAAVYIDFFGSVYTSSCT